VSHTCGPLQGRFIHSIPIATSLIQRNRTRLQAWRQEKSRYVAIRMQRIENYTYNTSIHLRAAYNRQHVRMIQTRARGDGCHGQSENWKSTCTFDGRSVTLQRNRKKKRLLLWTRITRSTYGFTLHRQNSTSYECTRVFLRINTGTRHQPMCKSVSREVK
jgi:hypothetical protein